MEEPIFVRRRDFKQGDTVYVFSEKICPSKEKNYLRCTVVLTTGDIFGVMIDTKRSRKPNIFSGVKYIKKDYLMEARDVIWIPMP